VLLVNPDARIDGADAQALAAHLRAEPDSVVSPCIVDSTGRPVFRGVELVLDDGTMRRAGLELDARAAARPAQLWLTGACLAVPLTVFERIGGFAEDYFLYWEDVDFSIRAVAAGARLQVRQDIEVLHDEGGTQGERRGRAKSEVYYRYNCRNRLLFAAHHLSLQRQLRWLLHTPKASTEILLRGGRRQLLHSPRPLLATLRGTLEGLGLLGQAWARRASQRVRATGRRATEVSARSRG
jgi:GT2 family glycosyltransferase